VTRLLLRLQSVNLSFDLGIAALFATFGLWATTSGMLPRITWAALGILIVALVVRRLSPSAALALGWLSAIVQIANGQDVSFLQFGSAILLYTAVAHGSRVLMVVAAASVLVAGLVAVAYLIPLGSWTWYQLPPTGGVRRRILIYGLLPTSLLGATWLAGLAARLLRERQAQAQARDAAETEARASSAVAAQATDRAELARNVHDVIGHSLAVIIAQSDSVQFLDATDPAAMRTTAAAIAETARRSLGEVRQVLTQMDAADTGALGSIADLDSLIDNVSRSGAPIDSSVVGDPRELDGRQWETAHRVLQEALTNALKYSDRARPIEVERRWTPSGLTLLVRNLIPPAGAPQMGEFAGSGIAGMRERLLVAGGSLEARVRDEGETRIFELVAQIPTSRARVAS
jgi:signal transduction histidine kinase